MNAACLVLLLATGCAPLLTQAIVSAPNRLNPLAGRANLTQGISLLAGIDEQFWVDVGPPAARLLVSVREPLEGQSLRGTVLVLHGYCGSSQTMIRNARLLNNAGYRAVLVDLRGHGQSSGELLTYGVQESRDLSQVIDELERRGLCDERLGVLGVSYGAATAVQLSAVEPRVKAVVALAPFANMRSEVPHYVHTLLLGSQFYLPEEYLQQLVDEAGEYTGVDPDAASPLAAIASTNTPTLIVHGDADWMVPPEHSAALHSAAPNHSELVILPRFGHTTLWLDPNKEVAEHVQRWFDQHLR